MNSFKLKYIISEEINKVADIVKAEKGINRKPSDAQKSAGNYKMGHIRLNGFDITIENPKGSYRYWKDENGKEGKTLINNHYGYFTRTLGKDGDQIDVFIGSKLKSNKVYVVDQNNDKGEFDESKVMLCFDNIKDAKKAYMSNYNKGWKGFRNITGVDIEVFKKWLYDGKKQRKPFSDYINIESKKLDESILAEYYNAYNSDDVDNTNYIEYYINEADPDDYDDEYYDSMEDFIEQETSYDIKASDYNDEIVFEQDGLTISEVEEIFGENIANMIRNREGKRGNYYYLSDLLDTSIDLTDVNQVNNMAKKLFPTTDEYYKDERGYILTDGTILIFGENTDHISITRIDGMTINKFISLGNIRIGHNFFDLQKEPTYEQRMQLIRLINSYSDDELYVDIGEYSENNSQYERKVTSAKYINPNYKTVLGEISQYFRDGIKLKGGYGMYESINKDKQLKIINKFNPMRDDYHIGIRSISDIKTLEEAMNEAMEDYKEYGNYSSYPDITNDILEDALSTGKIRIYSSYPIIPGVFVTPSKMQANEYAGGEKIYSKIANIDDIAWINVDEGQYVSNNIYEAKNEKKSGLEKFLDKHGIKEIKCGVGFSEEEQKWYGWSHRAIYGFGIGSKVKKGNCAYKGKEWTAKTLKDAKKMAEDFSKSVS